MSEDQEKKTLSVAGRKKLQLNPSAGAAASKGSGVVVQRRKKLVLKPGEKPAEGATAEKAKVVTKKKTLSTSKTAKPAAGGSSTSAPKTLTDSEREKRAKVLEQNRIAQEKKAKEEAEAAKRDALEAVARKKAEEKAKKLQAEEDSKRQAEEAEQQKAEAEAAKKAEEDRKAREKAEAEARKALEAEEKASGKTTAPEAKKPAAAADKPKPDQVVPRIKSADDKRPAPAKPAKTRNEEPRRRSGKLTITQALAGGQQERQRSFAALKRARAKEKRQLGLVKPAQKVFREVVIPDVITVSELANRMTEKGTDVIKSLMNMGVMATINQTIDQDTAELIVEEFGHKVKRVSESDVELDIGGPDDQEDQLEPRPPVVTVMGHVDHGKTSILDALRKTDVAGGEAGGITQHIGAYQVKLPGGERISFLDTPGHAAFTAMRSRGAQVTDIVILVVAADDSIKPQTIEAISHAKAAEVPIIVAINKVDKDSANPDKVRQDLMQHEVFVETMGGDVLDVEVSALKGTNLDKLEEAILLQAELLDLKANPDRSANGIVVEAKLDKGRGPLATVLVERGTLKVGDIFVCGAEWGRVRALLNERGQQLKEATPSMPVEILGLNGTPEAGDDFAVVDNEAKAREISEFRTRQKKDKLSVAPKASLENLFNQLKESEIATVPAVIKGDVQGSIEAITGALEKMSTDEVKAQVLHSAVGGISETDISLAAASSAPVIGFNVRASRQAAELADKEGVEIRYYSVIYDLVDDMKALMSGKLAPEVREKIIGTARILEVFSAGKAGKAAGCLVTDGTVRKGAKARLLRDDVVIYEGDLGSLRRFKDDVAEVKAGTECGMNFENYNDLKQDDVIECFLVEEIAREL